MSYWDTSALGKLYVSESDSATFEQRASDESVIVSCQLARFEMHRIAFRKESDGLIPAGTAEEVLACLDQDIAAGEIRVVETDSALEGGIQRDHGRLLPPDAAATPSHLRRYPSGCRPRLGPD